MNIEKLARIDLNLLVCLNVLAEELNVTRAAHFLRKLTAHWETRKRSLSYFPTFPAKT